MTHDQVNRDSIQEIADKLHLAPSTVKRVLTGGTTSNMKPGTVNRIVHTARRLGFDPGLETMHARRLWPRMQEVEARVHQLAQEVRQVAESCSPERMDELAQELAGLSERVLKCETLLGRLEKAVTELSKRIAAPSRRGKR